MSSTRLEVRHGTDGASVRSAARRAGAAIAAVMLAPLAAGCAQKGSVVLLPSQDEHASVSVRQDEREVVLDKPYAAARQMSTGGPQPYTSNAQEVQALFGAALAAQPKRPTTFTLYFEEGTEEFTPESKRILDSVLGEIATYPVPDIVVVGHTDAVGNDKVNDELSLRRAGIVRAALLARGVAPDGIVTVGRGKRQPRKATADGVAEPLNRRVEIVVR